MVYCESYPDESILANVDGAKAPMVVGCPGCANTCIYLRDAPAGSAMLSLSPTGFRAVSMQAEVHRLERLLSSRGILAGSWVGSYPTGILCMPEKRGRATIIKKCHGYDTIVTVCCDGGTRSLQKILTGKTIVPAMQARGLITACMQMQRLFTQIVIDKATVEIVKLQADRQG